MIFNHDASFTGRICIDDEMLAAAGVTDLEKYSVTPGTTKDFQIGPVSLMAIARYSRLEDHRLITGGAATPPTGICPVSCTPR